MLQGQDYPGGKGQDEEEKTNKQRNKTQANFCDEQKCKSIQQN